MSKIQDLYFQLATNFNGEDSFAGSDGEQTVAGQYPDGDYRWTRFEKMFKEAVTEALEELKDK